MIYQPQKLIIIGDSCVYGWGDIEEGGWSERLRQTWIRQTNSPIVYTLGVRGDGLEKVARRWRSEWECRGELRRTFPDGMIIAVGLNDTARIGRETGRPQLSSEAFRFGLIQMLKEIKKVTSVMVVGLTAVDESAMPFAECLWYSNKSSALYEAQIEEACLDVDIPFLPIFKSFTRDENWKRLLGPDGIHLNTEGHRWMYNKLISWPILLKWANLQLVKQTSNY
tara:strand:- start:2173 stop:2844 length:672 start_codon:yes stop_codon:yes gene_type:complete